MPCSMPLPGLALGLLRKLYWNSRRIIPHRSKNQSRRTGNRASRNADTRTWNIARQLSLRDLPDFRQGPSYFATLPVRPAFWRASTTSLSLKSPVTSNDSAFFFAFCSLTPGTDLTALSTAVTHLGQQRWTPSSLTEETFLPVAPVSLDNLMSLLLLLPK